MIIRRIVTYLILGAAVLYGCAPRRAEDSRPMVAVTVAPQAYFVERLAADWVRLEVIIPPGAGHLSYEPTSQQLVALSEAKIYVKVGHPHFSFETAWLGKILAASPSLRVVDSSAGIEVQGEDPHTWVAPEHARRMSRNIAAALQQLLPEHKDEIDARLAALERDIDALDRDNRALFESAARKKFYVFHPALGYFAAAYGLEQVAIEQGHKEPSPDELRRVLAMARAEGVKVVLVQPQYSQEAAGVVAKETNARLVEIDPEARDWLAAMRRTARAIAEALAP